MNIEVWFGFYCIYELFTLNIIIARRGGLDISMKAETIIRNAEEFLALDDNRKTKDLFLEKYSKCEVLCRPILQSYLKEIEEYTSDSEIGMELNRIKDAMADANYFFEDNKLLTRIFGKEDKQGKSSCRFLRNKISHELMKRALHEVVERKEQLNEDMDIFIEAVMNN
jgi:hypothetical protein